MSKQTKESIVKASFFLTIILIITKVIGIGREIFFANEFGTTKNFDLYLIGVAIPLMLNSVIYYLSQNYFIPNYYKYKKEHNNDSEFFNESLWLFVGFGLLISLILFAANDVIIEFYTENLSSEESGLVKTIFTIIIFTIPINTAFSICASYFVANNKVNIPYIIQLANNTILLLLIILLSSSFDIYSIPISYLTANTFQILFIIFVLRKYIKLSFPRVKSFSSFSKVKLSSFSITILIEFFSLSYIIIDRYFYPYVDQGGISAYNYALTIFNLPMSIFGATVAAILLPKFSQTFHNDEEKKSFERGISDSLNAVVILLLPVVILFIFHGVSIIRIIYQRGVFNFNDTLMTSSLLNILALGLVFYASYSVINKILYSAQLLRSFLILVIISVAAKYFINLYFVDALKQNALALSTVLSYSILLIGGIGILVYKLKLFFYKEYLKNLFYLSILAMLIFLISKLILKIFLTESLFFEILEMLLFVVIYFSTIYFADNSNNSITKKVMLSFGKSFRK